MNQATVEKKIKILENALAACAGAYYNINLTKNIVPGTMYQTIDGVRHNINQAIHLPENAPFTEVVNYWGSKLSDEEQPAYFSFFALENLLQQYAQGKTHVFHRYWTKTALFEPMLAEQHLEMYVDDETGDILAVSYVLDLTQEYREAEYKKELEEKQCKLEEALQEANRLREYEELQVVLSAVDEILLNITLLNRVSNSEELTQLLPSLLASMGKYSVADRAYIFEWASEEQQILRMTHEWCAEGVRPTFGEMQSVLMSDMPNWTPRLLRGETIVSTDWDAEKGKNPAEYALFDGQDIRSLIVVPIFSNKRFNGYIGFDNPEQSKTALSGRLLTSIAGHLGSLKENFRMMEQLEEKQASLQNNLVKLENALQEATLNSEIVSSISKIYWLIYRMNLISGTYEEISAGQEMHRLTGKHGNIEEVFRDAREQIVAPEHQEMMKAFLDTSTLADRLQNTDSVAVEYHAANGSWHLARFIAKRRNSAGRVTHVLYVVRQIDQQKQREIEAKEKVLVAAEDAKRANIAKTDFLRRMSHDIRTPINGIRGIVSIANHYPDDMQRQQDCRNKVMQASGFLLELVNNVLDMNKLESGVITLEHAPFDLKEVLEDTCNIIEMQGQEYAVPLKIIPWNAQHQHLLGSPLHIRQILQNVAANAIKYSRAGGTVTVSCDELRCEGNKAVFEFACKDNGIGMSEEFLKKAFDPFAQENQGARSSYTGTGLGLSITKQLVELMGGSISIQSKLGVGTCVTFQIPFEIDAAYHAQDAQPDSNEPVSLEGIRALVAEDNELNMEIAQFTLERAGICVTGVWNGQEAVDAFAKSAPGQFDVILMDVMMPVMDGLTATRTIRALEREDAKTIPILAMTANSFVEDIRASMDAGMNAHLSKPLSEQEILNTIRDVVSKRA